MSDYGLFLQRFGEDVEQRVQREAKLRATAEGQTSEQLHLQARINALQLQYDTELQQLQEEYQAVLSETTEQFEDQLASLQNSHAAICHSIDVEADLAARDLERKREDSEWVVSSVLDDNADDSPLREFEKFKQSLERSNEEQESCLQSLSAEFNAIANERGWKEQLPPEPDTELKNREKAIERFQKLVTKSDPLAKSIRSLILPRLFLGFRSLAVLVVTWACTAIPVFLFVDPAVAGVEGERMQTDWYGISAAAGGVGALVISGFLYLLGATKQGSLFRKFEDLRGETIWLHKQCQRLAEEALAKEERKTAAKQKKIERERQEALDRYENAHKERLAEIQATRDQKRNDELEKLRQEREQIEGVRDRQLQQIEVENERRLSESNARWGSEIDRLEAELKELRSSQNRTASEQWMQLKADWTEVARLFFETISIVNKEESTSNPSWEQLSAECWTPAEAIPRGIVFGKMSIDLHEWSGAISQDARLSPRTTSFELPAAIPFPDATSTLFQSQTPEQRTQVIHTLQTLMLRMLLRIPPGKLRFTMIDPIGLGESFGGFMHLADYDELMVTNRIWTEPGQIEARLADLTEHMENVFQTYLRNEFQTIEEYNESAGEVAEPYHILVISDFPAKFSEIAARRLVSIIQSGPRCGVYTLLNVDPTKTMPNNFELSDIEPYMTGFGFINDRLHATEAPLAPWAIEQQPPPAPKEFTSIVKMVGEASKDARRVEVAFDRIAPKPNQIWKGDSRHELIIPLGRAGATKLQEMKLGKGTSQHMLIAGKTGSGKSTFLHILITNLALHYSPNEVQFFLIDFKKGVEFKDYATCQLPHAQVVAIESDREFGVSALQRLDEVLQERGEQFRRHGVQDIAGYRNANPAQPLPRILLIVDEFQEFFIEDDKLSQTAALLLDRLVRQGRAFGIHVILGSQTLGGAYSLARTTLGQVAVRVALQCSEADAHLILSEENTAARLLTRPGEAIYNDANGMMEGNHPFQIAWLTDQQRRGYLESFTSRLERDGIATQPAIVFEGNIPSDIRQNSQVAKYINSFSDRQKPIATPSIWLGDAVEIQPPTEIQFHQQNGSNLLVVGQDADAAMGMMTSMATTLAAASSPKGDAPQLIVLDGNPPNTDETQVWKSLAECLPVSMQIIAPQQTSTVLETLTRQLQERKESSEMGHTPLFVFVHNIAKFRDLRKAEDDFGMGGFGSSMEEKPAEPSQLFADLLTDGAAYGIHFIIWCDSYSNVERSFSRQSLKELELRVAMQMNSADSSSLIDSPAASRLGTHRALLYREETGLVEKFRPYGTPPEEWLDEISKTMRHGPASDFATDLEEFSIL